jgi:hypothetical protein
LGDDVFWPFLNKLMGILVLEAENKGSKERKSILR